MNAVVIYRECDSARKAISLLKRASDRADAATQWSVKPWRLDLLSWPQVAQEAIRDTEEAHLLLLAIGSTTELPAELLYWLEAWALRRQVQNAALALFDGAGGDTLSASATPALSGFAQRHGLSLILGDIGPEEDESVKLWEDLHEREVAQTPTLVNMPGHETRGNYQRWGINE